MDIKIEEETNKLFDELTDFYYPKSPAMSQFQDIIKEELYDDYWIEPYELWYYYSIGYIQRFAYNYYDGKYDMSTFNKNMERSIVKFGNSCFKNGLDVIRLQCKRVEEYANKYKPTVWDNKTNKELNYHIEYIWITAGNNPCDICKSFDGKNLVTLDVLKAHWNCRCQLKQVEWYEDNEGNKYYESEKIL